MRYCMRHSQTELSILGSEQRQALLADSFTFGEGSKIVVSTEAAEAAVLNESRKLSARILFETFERHRAHAEKATVICNERLGGLRRDASQRARNLRQTNRVDQ